MIENPKIHKVCFLGYSGLGSKAREVISQLPASDVEYVLMECSLENQSECVDEAIQLGCSVFIAGSGNAALFSTRYDYPLVEIPVRYIDYVRAIHSVLRQGCHKICIVRHRYSPTVNLSMLEKLMETPLYEFIYEHPSEWYEFAQSSDYDAYVGTTMAVDTAHAIGRIGALLYSGAESIRDACIQAGNLARSLYETRRSRAITNALLNNSQFAIIVTDANDCVLLFNQTAQRFTGVAASQIRGKTLASVFPNLSTSTLIKSDQLQTDSYRLVEGAMMRCVQEKIIVDRQAIGVLLTLYPDSHNRKKRETSICEGKSQITYHWEELTAESSIMKKLIEQGQNLSRLDYPTTLLGASGSGRETIARCMHASSKRSQKSCITIDLATFAEDDIPHILMGYEKNDRIVSGLLASANGGSVIIKNLAVAKPSAQACLMQILNARQIFRPGMSAPLLLDVVIYTVMTRQEFQSLPPDLQSRLSVCILEIPSLTQRSADIAPLFLNILSHNSIFTHRPVLSEQMQELLIFHSWPGELHELQVVCMRYALAMAQQDKPRARTQALLLMQAIGEHKIFEEVLQRYPALTQHPIEDKKAFGEGIMMLKSLLKYSNDVLAEKLSVSRTTIWRVLQDAQT